MPIEIEPLIVADIKKSLGLAADYDPFDSELVFHINSAFADLHQLGVGPEAGFQIVDGTEEWSDFVGTDEFRLNNVRGYMFLAMKLVFDPPLVQSVLTSVQNQFERAEFRVALAADEIRRPPTQPDMDDEDNDFILDGGLI